MRMTTSRSSWLLALAVGAMLAPTGMRAQDAAPDRTYTVKEGDTLWDLARQFLGDPFLWPEIYRLNTTIVEDPHWIYPGEQLQMPTGMMAGAASAAPAAGAIATTRNSLFTQRRIGNVSAERLGTVGRDPAPAVRAGEFYAAPYVEDQDGPRGGGEILRSADTHGISKSAEKTRFQINDPVFITPPKNRIPTLGDKYLSYALGPLLDGVGRIVIPTGIVRVDKPGLGEGTLARVLTQFGEVKRGQGLIPLDSFVMAPGVRPLPVQLGTTAKVLWVLDKPVLPSLEHYLVIDATSRDGVRPGDQFTLMTGRAESDSGEELPDRAVAVVQVVRVTPYATTVIVIDQSQPKIFLQQPARLSAKMP